MGQSVRGWRGWTRWWVGRGVVAVLLVLGLGGALWQAAASRPVAAQPPAALYLIDAAVRDGSRLQPLDPLTLAPRADLPALEVASPDWAVSGDGATLVSLQIAAGQAGDARATAVTIVVRDRRTGAERARFASPAGACCPLLSHDGTRLALIRAEGGDGGVGPRAWYVLRSADGQVLASARAAGGHDWEQAVLDPNLRRLYRLISGARAGGRPGPLSGRLIVHDLTTGAEVGRLDLPAVRGGVWPTERQAGGQLVWAELTPGLALSPDGRRLALVHADSDALTLIDTERLAVERTVALNRPGGALEWLGLAPASVAAKGPNAGTIQRATFSPDGNRLYIFGVTTQVSDTGDQLVRGLGVRLVDLARGTIVAEALSGEQVTRLLPAPDGRQVYAVGPLRPTSGLPEDEPSRLRRLDAATLAILAEREARVSGWRAPLRLWPAMPGDWW